METKAPQIELKTLMYLTFRKAQNTRKPKVKYMSHFSQIWPTFSDHWAQREPQGSWRAPDRGQLDGR